MQKSKVKMIKLKSSLSALAVGASALSLSAVPAQAQIVPTWDFQLNNFWVNPIGGEDVTPDPAFEPTKVSWGVGLPDQSSIMVDELMGTITTSGSGGPLLFSNTANITHDNFIIQDGSGITGITLRSQVTLTPNVMGGTPQAIPAADFGFSFTETLNQAPCASVGDPACNDIFVLETINGVPVGNFVDESQLELILPDAVAFNGITYDYILDVGGDLEGSGPGIFRFLTDSECTAAGSALGCLGFSTTEEASTTVAFDGALEANPSVPEPTSTAAMIGFGALAFGALRKRKEVK